MLAKTFLVTLFATAALAAPATGASNDVTLAAKDPAPAETPFPGDSDDNLPIGDDDEGDDGDDGDDGEDDDDFDGGADEFSKLAIPDEVPAALTDAETSGHGHGHHRREFWTTRRLSRRCSRGDTRCDWRFWVETHTHSSGSPYRCHYVVRGHRASQRNGNPRRCKVFRIRTTYNRHRRHTVLTVAHHPSNRMINAVFSDRELAGGHNVRDRNWLVRRIHH